MSPKQAHQQEIWASGLVAAQTQAHCIALTHNLLTILLASLEAAGIREDKVARKQVERIQARPPARRVPARRWSATPRSTPAYLSGWLGITS